jgi:hypothetical protein
VAKEAWMDSTHVRVTSEDGRTSYLYEVDSVGDRTCTEIAERRADGTTDDYVPSGRRVANILSRSILNRQPCLIHSNT